MTPRAVDFRILNTQLTIFSKDPSGFSTNKFLAKVLDKYAETYDGDIQSLPLAASLPNEIPRIVLTNKEETLGLEISPTFVRSSINTVAPGTNLVQENFFKQSIDIFNYYIKSTSIEVNRISLSLIKAQESSEAAKTLIEYFCKPELIKTMLSKSEKFEIHYYEKTNIDDIQFNFWTRFKTAMVDVEGTVTPVIAIEQDINTPLEADKVFVIEEIEKYFNLSLEETHKTLELHFPSIN